MSRVAAPRPPTATAEFADLVSQGALDLPLPGSGGTGERFRALADLGRRDPVLARLGEAHADAAAILAELVGPPARPGELWGVWGAEPPGARLTADRGPGGWLLSGRKAYCSGAGVLTRALVTAAASDGPRLFAVEVADPGIAAVPDSWPAVGMADSDSRTMAFAAVPGEPVGGPRAYLDRPGFWHGAAGVAACWHGGAAGIADALVQAHRDRALDPHALAHLGAVDAALAASRTALAAVAAGIDADPADRQALARHRALRVRAVVERACAEVVDRVGRALGAGPLCTDGRHARRVADLGVYLRQSHAERDLETLARSLPAGPVDW